MRLTYQRCLLVAGERQAGRAGAEYRRQRAAAIASARAGEAEPVKTSQLARKALRVRPGQRVRAEAMSTCEVATTSSGSRRSAPSTLSGGGIVVHFARLVHSLGHQIPRGEIFAQSSLQPSAAGQLACKLPLGWVVPLATAALGSLPPVHTHAAALPQRNLHAARQRHQDYTCRNTKQHRGGRGTEGSHTLQPQRCRQKYYSH